MIKFTPLQKLEIFGLLNVSFSYFTIWNQFDIWITFGIIEKSLHGRSRGTIQPSSALDSPALQGSGPTMAHWPNFLPHEEDRARCTKTRGRPRRFALVAAGPEATGQPLVSPPMVYPPHVPHDLIPAVALRRSKSLFRHRHRARLCSMPISLYCRRLCSLGPRGRRAPPPAPRVSSASP
jgi:hypothetical protein